MRARLSELWDTLGALITRFSIVGLASTAFYFIVANILLASGTMSETTSSMAAYALSIAFSYVGHSLFTFKVERHSPGQILRFAVVSGCGFAISYYAVRFAVEILAVAAFWGTVLTSITVPIINFLVLLLWVFHDAESGAANGGH